MQKQNDVLGDLKTTVEVLKETQNGIKGKVDMIKDSHDKLVAKVLNL